MRITKNTPPLPTNPAKPVLKWQVDEFAKVQEFRFHLPVGFLLLCKLWDTTPADVIVDFIDNLGCGSWTRDVSDDAKIFLHRYATEMRYGQHNYSEADIEQMFIELEAIGMLWPTNAKMKMIKMHKEWSDKYYKWWFKKWYKKPARKNSG